MRAARSTFNTLRRKTNARARHFSKLNGAAELCAIKLRQTNRGSLLIKSSLIEAADVHVRPPDITCIHGEIRADCCCMFGALAFCMSQSTDIANSLMCGLQPLDTYMPDLFNALIPLDGLCNYL